MKKNLNQVVEGDFDWSLYEDGWNGKTRKANNQFSFDNDVDKVYCHEDYASEDYQKYLGRPTNVCKEIQKHSTVSISDLSVLKNGNILASVNNGNNNIIIDLDKEVKFLNTLSIGDKVMDKELFVAALQDDNMKSKILSMNLSAKVGSDEGKASIWDGYVETISNELKAQVTLNNKAYLAKIVSVNSGGFLVKVANVIDAFMPGSMVAANKIDNYADYLDKTLEVMVESYDERIGFVVSHKKYLRTIMPMKIQELEQELAKDKDKVFEGTITGSTMFGIFVELTDVLTGMLHKTLVSDTLRDAMRNNTITPGTKINVYVHKIENNKIVLSDVPSNKRDDVIARREAEDVAEKSARKEQQKAK